MECKPCKRELGFPGPVVLVTTKDERGFCCCTVKHTGEFRSYGEMFFDGRNVLASHYEE